MSRMIATLDPIDARVTRALTDVLPNYVITEHDGSLIMESPDGNASIVDVVAGTCSCQDAQSGRAPFCKHQIAARHLAIEQGRDLDAERRARRIAEWKAEMAAERAEIARRTAYITDEMLDRVLR
jgi:hypothetical protein